MDSPPPETFETLDEVKQYLQDFAIDHGYAVSTLRSDKKKQTVTLKCDLGGKPRSPPRNRQLMRAGGTRLINCPFRISIKKLSDRWFFTIKDSSHNHDPFEDIIAHPIAKRLSTEELETVRRMTNAGSKVSVIRSFIGRAEIDNRSLYNARAKIRRERLDGRSPLETLVEDLNNGEYVSSFKANSDGRVTHFWFARRSALDWFKAYPYVLLLDCTYKTNKYKMPLLHFVGKSGCEKPFSVSFAFLSGETYEDYLWAMRAFDEFVGLRDVSILVTDRENALINALATASPQTPHILCQWHVNKNITAKCMRHFSADAWKIFVDKWQKVIRRGTIEDFERDWLMMVNSCPIIVKNYLENTWYPVKEKFVSAWVDEITHLDNRTTSVAEGTHSFIKRFLGTSKGDMLVAVDRIQLGLDAQDTALRSIISKQKTKRLSEFSYNLFHDVTTKISYFALRKINEQRRMAMIATAAVPLPECTHRFKASLGLPCAHDIKQLITQNRPLTLAEVHPHWHLRLSEGNEPLSLQPSQILIEPAIVLAGRGRPAGSRSQAQSSTRRNLSEFELVEQSQSTQNQRRCTLCQQPGHNRRRCPVSAPSIPHIV